MAHPSTQLYLVAAKPIKNQLGPAWLAQSLPSSEWKDTAPTRNPGLFGLLDIDAHLSYNNAI